MTTMHSSKTPKWALSAIVLGIPYFLLSTLGFLFGLAPTPLDVIIRTVSFLINLLGAILAAVFIYGGVQTLKAGSAERDVKPGCTTLYTAAGAGIVLTGINLVFEVILFGSGVIFNMLYEAARYRHPPHMTPQMVENGVNTAIAIAILVILAILALQLCYCIGLYRHMASELKTKS